MPACGVEPCCSSTSQRVFPCPCSVQQCPAHPEQCTLQGGHACMHACTQLGASPQPRHPSNCKKREGRHCCQQAPRQALVEAPDVVGVRLKRP